MPESSAPSRDSLEVLYSLAFQFYQTGIYEKAEALFTKLTMSDPMEKRFWWGLASTHQVQRKFKHAVRAWAMVALHGLDDPMAHFHAGECLLSMGEREEGLKAMAKAKSDERLRERIEVIEKRWK